jgi:hypothetical protein
VKENGPHRGIADGSSEVRTMKNRAPAFFHGLLILLIPVFGAGEANADQPDQERIHESYVLTPGASVEVSGISGPVQIETGSGNTADVTVTRSAPTHAELQCGRVAIEQTPRGLRIRSETLCPVDHAVQHVVLALPRWADLSLEFIAGDVRIGPTDGMVRLNSIAGHVALAELRDASLMSLARGIELTVAGVGRRGIHVISVVGGIDLTVRDGVEVLLRSVNGRVHSSSSGIRIARSENGSDYRMMVGRGGDPISIDNVMGPVEVHRVD